MNFHSLIHELALSSSPEEEKVTYELVDDQTRFEHLIHYLLQQKEVCFDTTTTDTHPFKAKLVGVSFCVEPMKAWYVPLNGSLGEEYVLKELKKLFESDIALYGHNIKYDCHILENHGIQVKHLSFDTILASYILNSHSRQHSLDNLALNYFGKVKVSLASLLGKGQKAITFDKVPIEKVAPYACEEVDYTCRIKMLLEKELKERSLSSVFYDLELPLLSILLKMERHGIYLDVEVLHKIAKKISHDLKTLEEEIYKDAGGVFNINSPKQLSEILFVKLGIKAPKKTATGLSTNADVLESLQDRYPIAAKLMQYRTKEKLRSTYIESLPQEIIPETQRIHPTFNQYITATGRLSCQDPNLQNIPIRTEIGKEIREAFKPQQKEWSYLSADYSQIELRLLAHFSEDPKLIEAFHNNEDIHVATAASIFHLPLAQVTPQQRFLAKAVNFGIIYGQQAFGLSQGLHISMEEASAFIHDYFHMYPKVREYVEACKEMTRKTGKAVTLTGRERAIPEIHSKNGNLRVAAERLAINTPLQGTAADLIKMAMLKIDHDIKSSQLHAWMILQIHDELIFELPDEEIEPLQHLVKKEMEHVVKLKVPLIVEMSVGKNWKEC